MHNKVDFSSIFQSVIRESPVLEALTNLVANVYPWDISKSTESESQGLGLESTF